MNTFNLFGEIVANDSERWFESDIVPAMVVGWLNKQEGDVEININSPGGDVTAGLAIANAIKGYDKGKVTANVLGLAASMASVIACACDELKMGKGAFLMIHNPWTATMGNADDLRHDAEVLDKMRDSILAFYQTKTTADADALKALMDAESWLTLDDLTANGFTASAIEDGELKAAACVTRRAFASAPEAAHRFYSTIPSDWGKRFSGLQAAKDKEIAGLKSANEALAQQAQSAAERAEKAMLEAVDYGEVVKARDALTAERDQLKAQIEDQAKMHGEAVAEFSARIEALTNDLTEKVAALNSAKAEFEQLTAKYGETEKALAEAQASLEAETKRYREQVGLAMQPPEESPETKYQKALAAARSPEERDQVRKAHYGHI